MAEMEKCMNMPTMFVSNFKWSIKYTETFFYLSKKCVFCQFLICLWANMLRKFGCFYNCLAIFLVNLPFFVIHLAIYALFWGNIILTQIVYFSFFFLCMHFGSRPCLTQLHLDSFAVQCSAL